MLGPDDGYNVWLVNGAEPMWYSKYLFEECYRKVRNDSTTTSVQTYIT